MPMKRPLTEEQAANERARAKHRYEDRRARGVCPGCAGEREDTHLLCCRACRARTKRNSDMSRNKKRNTWLMRIRRWKRRLAHRILSW